MSKKIDVINDAYSQLRISGLTVQPSPESVEAALNRLDNMMAEFDIRSICLNYNFEEISDPNSLTNVPHGFNQMMATNLAVRLIPDFNKEVPQALHRQAVQSLSVASSFSARNNLNQVPYPDRQPIGGANTLRNNWWRRYYREQKPIKTDCNSKKMFIGEVNDFYEDYHTYLNGDSIQSFTIDSTSGLTESNSAINGSRIDYRVEAISASESNFQRINITITTTNGRVVTRNVNFNITQAEKEFI